MKDTSNSVESKVNELNMWSVRVTFPQPGGPQNISEGTCPDSRILRRMVFLPITPSCPTYSSMLDGLMTSARGALSSLGVDDFSEEEDAADLPCPHLSLIVD